MGKIIGYGKLGRSMPLTLAKCGNLGGDVEMVAVVKELALRHPDDTFMLMGRNTGEEPTSVGLPSNVVNPWIEWWPIIRRLADFAHHGDLSIDQQLRLADVFDLVTFPTFEKLDAMVMWVGQHGTSNTPIPKVGDPTQLTKPQDWCAWYSGFMLRGINHWRDTRGPWDYEEICLNADARNRHKMRDMKWPLRHPILAQYGDLKKLKHHRYGDITPLYEGDQWYTYADQIEDQTWCSIVHDTYARLEINGLRPGTPFGDLISFNNDWQRSGHFGLFINEARAIGVRPAVARLPILRQWVLPLDPYFIHGTWSAASKAELTFDHPDLNIHPAPWDQYYPKLHSVRTTFTTPSSGSGWATAKPWEAFAAGTVCFFHPSYDTQNNILGDAPTELYDWLRVDLHKELASKVQHLNSQAGRSDWEWIVAAQRAHFDRAINDLTYMKMIEKRIYE